jgi:amino acid adenylation domain-containing protein
MLPVQLPERNRREADYSRCSTIANQFEQQAAKTPDAIAVVYKDRQLSYRELDERSNRLARHLQFLGIQPETLVGVFMERSEALLIALLAILKAGGAYVPLDPSHPKDRSSFVIADSRIATIVTSVDMRSRLPMDLGKVSVLGIDDHAVAGQSTNRVTSAVASSNLAYVMYTSGSTGTPKGVMIEHRNVVNFFTGMDSAIGCDPGVWLAVTSFAFDISVLELLWTLTRGFKVIVHGDEGVGTIPDEVMRHGATHLQMTPSLARMLTLDVRTSAALAPLKQILLGGETVPASLIHRLRQFFGGDIHNMYGPTETTIWSTTYQVGDPGSTVPIGRPITNTQTYVLDNELKQAPIGEIGDLFIGGDGVARGYWNRPDQTAERFLIIPELSAHPIYRTGDLARTLPDGNIEFLGRADFQIKLRGHRIEPGEIEALLEQCAGVRQAVVVAREEREGDMRLVACVVADQAAQNPMALRSALGARLPEAMVPSAFVFLPALPLMHNGKIDRNALLKLPVPSTAASQSITEAESEIERMVAKAWQEALGVSVVRLNDNFFDLGAHSITVAEAQVKLQDLLQRDILLVDLYEFPTITSLSRHLSSTQMGATATDASDRARRRKLARQR